jgi:hypothetical protein
MAKRRAPTAGWYRLRFQILKRDNFTCRYCGQYAPNVILEVDHVIPVCEGGTDDPDNLVTACMACNQGKEGLRPRPGRRHPVGLHTVVPAYGATQTRQAVLLEHLRRAGPMSVGELVKVTGWNQPTVQVAVARLHKNHCVIGQKVDGARAQRWGAVA